ncbi:MAG TPA: hypothetical protein VI583_14840 [Cyclobacteriaceae bacterium]|nr:hypothetical protein [Cyclobacteriaceae bacterium]
MDHFSEGPACRGTLRSENVQWTFSARGQEAKRAGGGALKNDPVDHFSDEPACRGAFLD